MTRPVPLHCAGCGQQLIDPHPECERLLAFDPPRYCTVCGFRLDVQVYPGEVRSECRRCRRRASGTESDTT
jgi:hypothetical protein